MTKIIDKSIIKSFDDQGLIEWVHVYKEIKDNDGNIVERIYAILPKIKNTMDTINEETKKKISN